MRSGVFFSIEEFSVFDGPGIRTTVFLKGCPLHCSWCHNPEGQSVKIEYVKSPNGCTGCGNCIKYSQNADGTKALNKECAENCPRHLIRRCGEEITSEALTEKILKNAIMLKDGGVTFSGGEPLMQGEFLLECLSRLKGKVHTAIQTSGYCDVDTFKKAVASADYFLFDLKIADEKMHRKYTGVSNERILKNFDILSESQTPFVVRIPLIPGVTDTEENISQLARILVKRNVGYAELLPYNKMAGSKYKMTMREYKPMFDEKKQVETHIEIFQKYDIEFKVL